MLTNKKLLEVFKLSQEDSLEGGNIKSIFWQIHTEKKNYTSEKNLINFRHKQILSQTLDDSENLTNELDIIETLKFFDNDFLKKNLPLKNVGNCDSSICLLGHYYDWGISHHLKWYEEISMYINGSKTICEIGGGFGSLARIIINNNDAKYILIDLPEQNLLASYYLKENFPNKKFYLYDNYKADTSLKKLDDFDIFVLTPWCKIDKSIKVDFFINSRSMMEMTYDSLKEYFDLMQTHITPNGYFLNVNRDYKAVPRKDKKKEILNFYDYPYDSKWDVIISRPSWQQPLLHFMLTQRKYENFKNNIKDEFIRLKEIFDKRSYDFGIKRRFSFVPIGFFFKKYTYIFLKKLFRFIFRGKIKKVAKIFYSMSK